MRILGDTCQNESLHEWPADLQMRKACGGAHTVLHKLGGNASDLRLCGWVDAPSQHTFQHCVREVDACGKGMRTAIVDVPA